MALDGGAGADGADGASAARAGGAGGAAAVWARADSGAQTSDKAATLNRALSFTVGKTS
jgi:hypothetical protein